jgi:hypothetical protein
MSFASTFGDRVIHRGIHFARMTMGMWATLGESMRAAGEKEKLITLPQIEQWSLTPLGMTAMFRLCAKQAGHELDAGQDMCELGGPRELFELWEQLESRPRPPEAAGQ